MSEAGEPGKPGEAGKPGTGGGGKGGKGGKGGAGGAARGLGTAAYRLDHLERSDERRKMEIERLEDRQDKFMLAFIGFAATFSVFGLGLAVTMLTQVTS